MGRWTGSWISGPRSAGLTAPTAVTEEYPGQRLGLPPTGPGSAAHFPGRLAAFAVDSVLANLLVGVARIAGLHPSPGIRGEFVLVAFLAQEFVLVAGGGATIGMLLAGLRVVRAADGGSPAALMVGIRTALLALLVPAVIWDRDGRGMHDRASGTVVVRSR